MSDRDRCPDATTLQALLAGKLSAVDQARVSDHLEGCCACQKALDRLTAESGDFARAVGSSAGEVTGERLRRVIERARRGADPERTAAEPAVADDALEFLDPPAQPGHLGRLGHYEILEVIGRGGFGVVLKALDEKLQRVVAVKVLSPSRAAGTARKRFLREAKAAAAVSHDHVVPIYHVDEVRGISFLVMPLVPGRSLQDRIDQAGPLELKEVLRIGMQVAEGLAAAHKQGLVHRDIKPANILLENGVERVKITDFGLARAIDDASVTQSGVLTGTPLFMSPEQARGEYVVDHRSDLFSLGSVLYTMCGGRAPFRAAGVHAVLRRVIEDTPRPLREINPDVPDWLVAIIDKLLAKSPADRFASAAGVAELLRQHLAHLQEPKQFARPAAVEPVDGKAGPAVAEKLLDATDTRQRRKQFVAFVAGIALIMISMPLFGHHEGEALLGLLGLFLGGAALVVAARARQDWEVTYRGHRVRFRNSALFGERLFIDDKRVSRGGLGRRRELRGVIRHGDGAGDEIMALTDAGFLSYRCRIYAEHAGPHAAPVAAAPAAAQPSKFWKRVGVALLVAVPVLAGLFVIATARRHATMAAMERAYAMEMAYRAEEARRRAGAAGPHQQHPALNRLIGTWRTEVDQRLPNRERATGFARYEAVADGRFLRELTWNDQGEYEAIRLLSYDAEAGLFRDWLFNSNGSAWEPGTGSWDANARTLTFYDTTSNGQQSVNVLRAIDHDRGEARWTHLDQQGKLTFDLRIAMTRVEGGRPVTFKPMPTDPERPSQLKRLDRLAGDWSEEMVVRSEDAPRRDERYTADVTSRWVLAGRFLERWSTPRVAGRAEYELIGYDPTDRKFRRWQFAADGNVSETMGSVGTDNAGQTLMKWQYADGRPNATWEWPSADEYRIDLSVSPVPGQPVISGWGTAKRRTVNPAAARPDDARPD
jgi:serine/threonine protein kinase